MTRYYWLCTSGFLLHEMYFFGRRRVFWGGKKNFFIANPPPLINENQNPRGGFPEGGFVLKNSVWWDQKIFCTWKFLVAGFAILAVMKKKCAQILSSGKNFEENTVQYTVFEATTPSTPWENPTSYLGFDPRGGGGFPFFTRLSKKNYS